jgi:hypothetical protein
MAKRARGTVRPGQRRPIDRRPASTSSAVAPAVAPRPSGLTEAEERRAAELETALLAEERAAEVARTRTRLRSTREPVYAGTGGSLAIRAEEEYAYVARDVKRITRIAALLLSILFALWILIDVAKVIKVG